MCHAESHYETWVLTLRSWAQDPRVGLAELPRLSEADLPPDAWSRLIEHLLAAQRTVMRTFQERLGLLVEQAHSDFALAQALIESRRMLQHRVDLAHHPSLPEELRDTLVESCRTDIHQIQQELEELMLDGGRNTPRETAEWDRRLMVVRQNPLTAVLRDTTPPSPTPATTPPPSPAAPAMTRWAHRRLQ